MTESFHADAGKRFASDLRRIREHRGITIEALHDETKIPTSLIDSFEQTGLFDHPMFNRVYLRSFVRTYSQVVGIAQDSALSSLDEALDGTYRGRLAQEYLGLKEQPPEAPVKAAITPEEETPTPVIAPGASADLNRTLEPTEVTAPSEQVESTPPPPVQVDVEPRWTPAATPAQPEQDRPAVARPQRIPVEREVEPERASRTWMYVLLGVAGVAVIGFLLFNSAGSPDEPAISAESESETAGSTTVVEDTTAVATPAPTVTVGDTMDVTIIAAGGPVQNIKVTVDDDLRRPYWIEQGESRTFKPTQRIIIERQLPKIQLRVEGQPYPTDRRDAEGRIIITRDSALQVLRSVQ